MSKFGVHEDKISSWIAPLDVYNIWQKHIHKECMTSTAYLYTKVGSSSTFKREVHRHAIRWCYWVELLDCKTLSEQTKEIYQTRVEFPSIKQLPVKLSLRVKAPVKTDTELPWYDKKIQNLFLRNLAIALTKIPACGALVSWWWMNEA